MAQGLLSRAAVAVVVLVAGVVAEAIAPAASALLTLADLIAGASCVVAGALLARPARRRLLLATGACWFAGTAATHWSGPLAAVLVLLYRAPLIGAVMDRAAPRSARVVTAAGLLALLLPLSAAGLTTSALLAVAAVTAVVSSRTARVDERAALLAPGLVALMLVSVWDFGALGIGGNALQVTNSVLVCLLAATLVVSLDPSRSRLAADAVVIELAATSRGTTPITSRLRRLLADPFLEVRYLVPAVGWVDDLGRPVAAPDEPGVTLVPAAGGGAVALIHGPTAQVRPELSAAAAAAGGLAHTRVRTDAEVRLQADLVTASRRRLLEVADAERRALEAQLRAGPLALLGEVDELLPSGSALQIREELRAVVDDVIKLCHGLYPSSVSSLSLEQALLKLAAGLEVSATVTCVGPIDELTEHERALVWFFCSESLTNVVRHARATHAFVACEVGIELTITVTDDGVGGASLDAAHGLRGLADRLAAAGGELDISSPMGGPTEVRAIAPRH